MVMKLKIGQSGIMAYASTYWPRSLNQRIDYGNPFSDLNFTIEKVTDKKTGTISERVAGRPDNEGVVYPLFGGWDARQNCSVVTVEHHAALLGITVEQVLKECEQERRELIATWEADENLKVLAPTAREQWFPGGKFLPPDAIGEECFRRSLGIMGAIYRRKMANIEGANEYPIRVVVKQFASNIERLLQHAQENAKDSGRKKFTPQDWLKVAWKVFQLDELGCKESTLRPYFETRGEAIRCYYLCRLNYMYPELNIVERCLMPQTETTPAYSFGGPLNMRKLHFNNLQWLANGKDIKGVTPAQPHDADSIENSLAELLDTQGSGGKSISSKDVHIMLGASSNRLLRQLGEAVKNNDAAYFKATVKALQELLAPPPPLSPAAEAAKIAADQSPADQSPADGESNG